ncbi:hypothetical protein HYU19_05310 [Candidatus Woesearchaeota archaeon]|nr:hypothetical protein [Candidatus Woesearchaeota archaeon]
MASASKGRVIDTNYRSLKGGKHISRGHIKPLDGQLRSMPFESPLKLKSRDLVEFSQGASGMADIKRILPARKSAAKYYK